jgi:uncharacterized protein
VHTPAYTVPAWQHWLRRGAVAFGGGFVSATVATALYVAEQVTRASKALPLNEYSFTPFDVGVDWERVRIPLDDGAWLGGWWFRRPQSDKLVIACHGYRGRKTDLLGIGAALWRHGYNVLLFDYRGHGEHAGTRVTVGYRELQDTMAAIRYARQRLPAARLGLIGYSMGAAVAIMAAAREPNIEAVVADSPFATQRSQILRQMIRTLRIGWWSRQVLFVADHLIYRLAGYWPRDVEPIRDVARIVPRPLLLIHGLEDRLIDPADSRMLYEAAGEPKELWLVEGVDHCGAYFLDRTAYVDRVFRFFDTALATAQETPARQQAV